MDTTWKTIIWNQFGAAIDMLENAIRACPDEVWEDFSKKPEWKKRDIVGFWYLVFHTLFWLDYYLSDSDKGFAPPAPFTLREFDPEGALPERVYTKEELLIYLEHGRQKFRHLMAGLTWSLSIFMARFRSPRDTVNDRSVMPSWLTFCTITSTLMPASAMGPRIA